MDLRASGERKRRLLMLTPFAPDENGSHGGARSTAALIKSLAQENRVGLAFLRGVDEAPLGRSITDLCEFALEGRRPGSLGSSIRPFGRSLGTIRKFISGDPLWVAGRHNPHFAVEVGAIVDKWRPHVVQGEFSAMGQYIDWGSDRAPASVVTFHEPGVTFAGQWINRSRWTRPFWRAEFSRWQGYEAELLSRLRAAVVFTPRDAAILADLYPEANVQIIPLGVEMPEAQPSSTTGMGSYSILFVGNLVHPPNLDAVEWLVRDILPLVRQRLPEAKLYVVGPGAVPQFARSDGVTTTGMVPDVNPYMQSATVLVAPLRSGGGMRVKVLEAMAAAKPVVATSLAMEGIAIRPGRDVLIANTARDFAEAILRLLADDSLRSQLGANARAIAERDHSMRSMAMRYENLYDRLLAESDSRNEIFHHDLSTGESR